MTLTEFLLARIAEDEAYLSSPAARYARDCPECAFASDYEPTPYRLIRLLAECEAKRLLMRGHGSVYASDGEYVGEPFVLRALALPYADHPDYHDEWKP